ncbi:Uncharacterised protein r2_g1507 [Pycnogonum litorale]
MGNLNIKRNGSGARDFGRPDLSSKDADGDERNQNGSKTLKEATGNDMGPGYEDNKWKCIRRCRLYVQFLTK